MSRSGNKRFMPHPEHAPGLTQSLRCRGMLGSVLAGMLGSFLLVSSALAQSTELAPVQDHALIGAQVLESAHGRIGMNLAAGRGNLQANGLSMAVGAQVQASSAAQQHTVAPVALASSLDASARIEAGALRNSHGLISVNQAAGEFNRQANLISIAVVSDASSDLAATEDQLISANAGASTAPNLAARGGARQVHAAEGAFERAQGVVQVSQVAGVQNTVSNTVVLRVSGPGSL
jgi:hypothetical protein